MCESRSGHLCVLYLGQPLPWLGEMGLNMQELLPSPQEISGWYYLLGEDLGRTKHLKVAMRRLKQSTGVFPPQE